ncbi:MAG: hypothetical protein AAFN81_01270 [Bacteroidota bacterium]
MLEQTVASCRHGVVWRLLVVFSTTRSFEEIEYEWKELLVNITGISDV